MGKRSNFARIERDFYKTPEKAVEPLLRHLEIGTTFIEPCVGDYALAGHLEIEGMLCVQSFDIVPQASHIKAQDALGDWRAHELADYIITNPPWNVKTLHPMIEKFSSIKPTWLLFYADWVHTKQAAPYLPKLSKIVSVGRVKWFPETNMCGKDNCAWHLFDANNTAQTEFYGRS